MKHLIKFNESIDEESIEILRRFAERFESGLVGPDGSPIECEGTNFAEFYHELRNDGIDGMKILRVLGNKLPVKYRLPEGI